MDLPPAFPAGLKVRAWAAHLRNPTHRSRRLESSLPFILLVAEVVTAAAPSFSFVAWVVVLLLRIGCTLRAAIALDRHSGHFPGKPSAGDAVDETLEQG